MKQITQQNLINAFGGESQANMRYRHFAIQASKENYPNVERLFRAIAPKLKVLFVCIHNSARSQMAEAFLKRLAGERFEVESAGVAPGKLNPLAVEVMKEIGIDISQNKTKSAFDFCKQGKTYDYVITVCDESRPDQCPIFPGASKRIHWRLKDPSGFQGTWNEKLAKTRKVRNEIKDRVEDWYSAFN